MYNLRNKIVKETHWKNENEIRSKDNYFVSKEFQFV